MPKESRIYSDLPAPVGPYAHCVEVDQFLFISGCTARGTNEEYGDVLSQTTASLNKIQHILAKYGLNIEALVKISFYLTDMQDSQEVQDVRRRYFTDPSRYPASLMVGVQELAAPHLKVEIDGIAKISN